MPIEFFEPTLTLIQKAREEIKGTLIETPTLKLDHPAFVETLGPNAWLKLELFQQAGSFKARGAYLAIQSLNDDEKSAGVVAFSAGNHAIASAWAAKAAAVDVKVCLPKTADPFRVQMCEALGATVVICEDIADAFAQLERIQREEGRTLLHPFESPYMTLGAATCAAEYLDTVPDLDVAVVPVGGGGFISGMAAGFKLLKPSITVLGVEPEGAQGVTQGLATGSAQQVQVDTIADSLGAPMSSPFSLGLIQKYVDDVALVSDDDLRHGMRLLAETINLLPEPACAASLIGAMRPLSAKCYGQNLGLIACGSNVSVERWQKLVQSKD